MGQALTLDVDSQYQIHDKHIFAPQHTEMSSSGQPILQNHDKQQFHYTDTMG